MGTIVGYSFMSNQTEKGGWVPKLRFPEFRDAGEWVEKKLADVLNPAIREVAKPNSSYLALGIRSHGKGTFHKPNQAPEKNSMERLYLVHRDDLIVNITFAWEGAIAIAGDDDHGSHVSHRFPTYAFKSSVSMPAFFRYVITSKVFVCKLGLISPGGAGRNRVMNKGDFLKLSVLLPAVQEQQKIADCLASLDERIILEAQQLGTLKAHKKGLMQQLFPAEGETLPQLRFPEFRNAGEWEISPLSKFVSSLDAGVSVVSGDRPAVGSEVGILKTSAVTNGVFNPQENKIVLEKGELARVKEPVSADSVIISRMNTPALVGANAYISDGLENLFLPDRLWAAKPRRTTSMRFIASVLGSEKGRAALSKLATGTSGSMKNITKPDVLALEITAPSFDEQQKIADCLASLDDLITAQTQKLAALKTHKQGLMQQLFPSMEYMP